MKTGTKISSYSSKFSLEEKYYQTDTTSIIIIMLY